LTQGIGPPADALSLLDLETVAELATGANVVLRLHIHAPSPWVAARYCPAARLSAGREVIAAMTKTAKTKGNLKGDMNLARR
jgi:hypothetical protein